MDQNQRSPGFWLTEDFLSCHWPSCFQTAPVSKESIVVYRRYLMHPYFILWRYYQAGSPSFTDEGTSKQRWEQQELQGYCLVFLSIVPYLSNQPISMTFSDLADVVPFFKISHPEKDVMLFGKWNWQASSFCRTRSPRTSDLEKKHCVSLSIGKNFSLIGKKKNYNTDLVLILLITSFTLSIFSHMSSDI